MANKKYNLTKQNVTSFIEDLEKKYRERYVKALNEKDREKQIEYLAGKNALQNLAIAFEKEF